MSIFNKARELSSLILESNEYKNLEKIRVRFESDHNTTKDEFIKAQKEYNNFIEQIFSLIRMNVCDEETIEDSENKSSKCSSCTGCKGEGCSEK